MNIIKFSYNFREIKRTIEITDGVLDQDIFPQSAKKKFNQSLENIIKLLNQDASYQDLTNGWHIAHRIVQFQKLHAKIKNIRAKLSQFPAHFYLNKKIPKTVLWPLNKRVVELTQYLESMGRLPFDKGSVRDQFYQKVEKRLKIEDPQKTKYAEKEFFHFLGNSLTTRQLDEIDTKSYIGNLEIYSLVSWQKVICEFIEQGDSVEKLIGENLLTILQQATPIALKISYAGKLPQIIKENSFSKNDYFKDFERLCQSQDLLPSLSNDYENDFMNKYTLNDSKGNIPKNVLINEIAWDILESIDQMKQFDVRIFTLGTNDHSVIVQVRCLKAPTLQYNGKYVYTIFNTGTGTKEFHLIKEEGGETIARPLMFFNLGRKSFSYFFIAELVRLSLQESTVDEFYRLHDRVLVDRAGGKKMLDKGSWYQTQKWGTCTYSAVEAWINSYLNAQQRNHLKFIKVKMSIRQQQKIVQILRKEAFGMSWQVVNRKNRTSFKYKRKRLEDSQRLLQLGKEHFNKIKKE
jgi:hypothetical protein